MIQTQVAVLLLALGCQAGEAAPATPKRAPAVIDWPSLPSKATAYHQTTAGAPRYDDKILWPNHTGKEAYVTQAWPKTRTLVWAKPGTNGHAKPRGEALQVADPASWTENGVPAKDLWDMDTDLVIPDADKPYTVFIRDLQISYHFRHLTVGRNACVMLHGPVLHGSLWVKAGGRTEVRGGMNFVGQGHAFLRNDNRYGYDENLTSTAQYFNFAKAAGVTVEALGHIKVVDEWAVCSGTLIIGMDTLMRPGRNCRPVIERAGTVALMDGARLASWSNDLSNAELCVEGTLLGGLPERPLTRSCSVGLGFKNYTGKPQPDGKTPGVGVCLILRDQAMMRSHSTDLARATLEIDSLGEVGIHDIRPPDGSQRHQELLSEGKQAWFAWYDALPRGADVFVGKGVVIEGVLFDHLRKGGLLVADPAIPRGWKNVAYGPNNAAIGADLVTVKSGLANGFYQGP